MIKNGYDPKVERIQEIEKIEKEKKTVFQNVLDEFMEDKSNSWKGGRSGENYKKWNKIMGKHVLPVFGNTPPSPCRC